MRAHIKPLIAAGVFLMAGCSAFTPTRTINLSPPDFDVDDPLSYAPSVASVDIIIPLSGVTKAVNGLMAKPISGKGSGEFDESYRAKSENPLYDPNKWIKTKDPLYNKRKWLKACVWGGCVKTKNPLYHPNKWLKTKNPKYNPNRWIYADTVRVQIGYNWYWTASKGGEVSFNALDDETVRTTLPLVLEGEFGFEGDGAKLLSLTKKKVKAKINVTVDTTLKLGSDWCPSVDVELAHQWTEGPEVELAGGGWFNLAPAVNLMSQLAQTNVEQEIQNQIDCRAIQAQLKDVIRPTAFELTKDYEGFFLNILPRMLTTSGLRYVDQSARIGLQLKANTFVAKDAIANTPIALPEVVIDDAQQPNLLTLTIPVDATYSQLKLLANEEENLAKLNAEFGSDAFKVKELDFASNGDRVTVEVALEIKTKAPRFLRLLERIPLLNTLFNSDGKVYLTATPYVENNVVRFTKLDFRNELDNPIYPLLTSVFKAQLIKYLAANAAIDANPIIEDAKAKHMPTLIEVLNSINGVRIEPTEVTATLGDAVYIRPTSIKALVLVSAGFEAEIKP